MRAITCLLLILIIPLACCQIVQAEEGILVVQVSNPLGQVIPNVVLSATGDSSTSASTEVTKQITEVAGKVRIRLAGTTRPGDKIELIIVRAPQDLVFISPWDQGVIVPCFEDNTRCVAKVILAERGSRMLLEYPPAQLAMAQKVNAANAAQVSGEQQTEEQRRETLAEVAKLYGLRPEDVDRAIRALREKATDPYELGQIALYERNYPEATKQLTLSVEERKRRLECAKCELAAAQFFLGQSLSEQVKYREAVAAFQEAATLRPNNKLVLNNLGLALMHSGEYKKAEGYLQRSAEIREKQFGPEHPDVAIGLNNLASVYDSQGRYSEAEPLLKRALATWEKQLGLEDPRVATSLSNLASVYQSLGRFPESEPLFRRSLAIREKQLGTDHLDVAISLNNLASLYTAQGRYAEAEPLFKRALSIKEKQLEPEHPRLATSLICLAILYERQGRYSEAEPLFKRGLAIDEKRLGTDHPEVAVDLRQLGLLYLKQGRYAEAEPLFERAMAINEKQLDPKHPRVTFVLGDYASLLRKTNRIAEAEKIEARAEATRAWKR